MTQKRNEGFTLIELLIVVAIIGLLASVIAVGFGNFRLKSRDVKRISDMRQIRTGFDLYYSSAAGYPDQSVWYSGNLTCNGHQFMHVPADPSTGVPYIYEVDDPTNSPCGGNAFRNYYVMFTTEGPTDLGPAGDYYLTTKGYTNSAPF